VVILEDIIERCKKYDVTAQRLLYERYANQMRYICLRYISNHEIKDIVQEGFIKVFANIKQYNGKGSFEGWMVRIFINTSLKHLKKNKKWQHQISLENLNTDNFDVDTMESYDSGNEILDDYQSIDSVDFTQEEIMEVVLSIPESYRIIFNLFHLEEFKHEEIAQMLDIDVHTSRTRLFRARNLIRTALVTRAKEKQHSKLIGS